MNRGKAYRTRSGNGTSTKKTKNKQEVENAHVNTLPSSENTTHSTPVVKQIEKDTIDKTQHDKDTTSYKSIPKGKNKRQRARSVASSEPTMPEQDKTKGSSDENKVSEKSNKLAVPAPSAVHVPSDTESSENAWQVGDLAWARVGKHPYWPCMVALDPEEKIYLRTKSSGHNKSGIQRSIHVQFFGDNGLRSWVVITHVMKFEGKESFQNEADKLLSQASKKKDKNHSKAFQARPASKATWESAVAEAEAFMKKSSEERVRYFSETFPTKDSAQTSKKRRLSNDTPESKPLKKLKIKMGNRISLVNNAQTTTTTTTITASATTTTTTNNEDSSQNSVENKEVPVIKKPRGKILETTQIQDANISTKSEKDGSTSKIDGVQTQENNIVNDTPPNAPNIIATPDIKTNDSKWAVGDLAWARIGRYPFWPCMISVDPELGLFTKTRNYGPNKTGVQHSFHVQFFADNGRHSWVFSTQIMKFEGKEQFDIEAKKILDQGRKKDKTFSKAFSARGSTKPAWEAAVSEAEEFMQKSREERVKYFSDNFPLDAVQSSKHGKSNDETTHSNKRKKSSEEILPAKRGKSNGEVVQAKKGKTNVETVQTKRGKSNGEAVHSNKRSKINGEKRPLQVKHEPENASTDQSNPKLPDKKENSSATATPGPSTSQPKKRNTNKKKAQHDAMLFGFFQEKHSSQVAGDHPTWNEEEILDHLKIMWEGMDETTKLKYKPRLL